MFAGGVWSRGTMFRIGTRGSCRFLRTGRSRSVRQGRLAFISPYLNSDPVAWVNFISEEFAWRGDSIASLISQVIGKQSIDRSKLEKMLGLLREAFARPAINRNAGDQNPVATFALLDQLQQDLCRDASALAEIDSTRRYVIGA